MFLDKIEGSPTLELVNLVLNKQAKGERVLSLAIGEPSFNTPKEIVEEAYRAMLSGDVHYTSSYGTFEVREAIVRKVKRKNGINAEIKNTIFITTKLAVYAAMMAVHQAHYEILLPNPGYFYSEPAILSGATPVHYNLKEDFSLDLDEIKSKITQRTKAIVVNSPSNPTGKVYTKRELEQLYEICSENGIYIISDEAYEDLVYDTQHFSIGSLEKEPMFVISLFSLSKSYAMTGWRAGYIIANERIINLVNKLLENTLTCFPPFIQHASAYALDHGDKFIQIFRDELRKRRKLMMEKIEEIRQFSATMPDGAFYVFPRYKTRIKSFELAHKILEKAGVATLPGSSFGSAGEGHLRLSYASSEETIIEAMDKIKKFFLEF
jgi:aspartate aminotransferase